VERNKNSGKWKGIRTVESGKKRHKNKRQMIKNKSKNKRKSKYKNKKEKRRIL